MNANVPSFNGFGTEIRFIFWTYWTVVLCAGLPLHHAFSSRQSKFKILFFAIFGVLYCCLESDGILNKSTGKPYSEKTLKYAIRIMMIWSVPVQTMNSHSRNCRR